MGKDRKDKTSSGDIGGYRTKQSLKNEYISLKKELEDLQRRHVTIYRVVDNLSEKYRSSKHHIPLWRYWELKNMTRACVTESDVVLQEDDRYCASNSREENGEDASSFNVIIRWSSTANEMSAAMEEVSTLHKAEIAAGIEEMKRQISKQKQKLLRLHNRLDQLKRDYAESKRNFPTTRYRRIKEMIKPLIRDETLKVN